MTRSGSADGPAEELGRLVTRIENGDASAEEEVVLQLGRRVFVLLLGRVGDADAARDLAQETLMAVILAVRRRQLRHSDRLAAFVHGIARNLANDYLRSRRRAPQHVELTPEVACFDARHQMDVADRMRLVRQGLARLDATDRRIVLLSVVHGHTARAIAGLMRMTADAVRARKSRALRKVIEDVAECHA